jgi:2,5-furandicarboxylate decarboxylase 1
LVEDLRSWISSLDAAGMLYRVSTPADARDISRIISEHYQQATFFENVSEYRIPVLANSVSSRKMIALALGCGERDILQEYLSRISNPIEPSSSSDSRLCQEETVIGSDRVDLTSLPILLQHEFDGAPYISAGIVVAKDPMTSDYNVGIYRLMFRTKNELGINITAPHRLRWFYQKALDMGRPLEVAVCLGLHALDLLAAVTGVPEGKDELAVWGGIRKEPLQMVKCKTLDLYVPSHAEIVLEATMQPTGWTEAEGPYGEFPGTYSGMRMNPVMKVQAITTRSRPIYQSATHGGKHLGNTDFFVIVPQIELSIFQALRHAGIDAKAVRVLSSSAGMVCYVSISSRTKGDSRNALYVALSGSRQNFPKYCVVVDSDIDIFDDQQVLWAIATRSQPKEDVIILEGMRIPSSSDPSLVGPPYSMSKMGLDATIPIEMSRMKFEFSKTPNFPAHRTVDAPRNSEDSERIAREIQKKLEREGHLSFYEIIKDFNDESYRSILTAWSRLRESSEISQDGNTGKYFLTKNRETKQK